MQAARHLVSILVELAAGVQLRENDLGSRTLRILVVVRFNASGNATTIITHCTRAVRVQSNRALIGVAD